MEHAHQAEQIVAAKPRQVARDTASAAPSAPLAVPGLAIDVIALGAQPSLQVGAVNDPCEVAAEEQAHKIVAALRERSSTLPEEPVAADAAPLDQLRRTASSVGSAGGQVAAQTERDIQSARGSGRPLETTLRRRLEPIMGADLSGVRLHEGPVARRLNDDVQAKAFTLGADVFFRDGIPAPGADDHLLAHELTHTVQQSAVPSLRRVIRRAPDDKTIEMPQGGVTYTLEQARRKLNLVHPSKAPSGTPNRRGIAKAWGTYIFDTLGAQIKPGKVHSTYKSSFDKGHDDEFSVSQAVDGVPEIVIHAHMDKDGKAKDANGTHWKWADKEMANESYQLSDTARGTFVSALEAKKNWEDVGQFTDWMNSFKGLT